MTVIDDHSHRFAVEPICVMLKNTAAAIAPSTYYAAKRRAPAGRAVLDKQALAEITRVHADRELGRGLYGALKGWHQLKREGGSAGNSSRHDIADTPGGCESSVGA